MYISIQNDSQLSDGNTLKLSNKISSAPRQLWFEFGDAETSPPAMEDHIAVWDPGWKQRKGKMLQVSYSNAIQKMETHS